MTSSPRATGSTAWTGRSRAWGPPPRCWPRCRRRRTGIPRASTSPPSLSIDDDDGPDGTDGPDIDDETDIDDIDDIDIDEVDDGPDGPDGLDVSDDDLDTSTFRAPDDYEDDGEEAAEPAVDAQTDLDADLTDAPALPADTDGGIDQAAGHESFTDTDDDGDAVDVPEPEDDDL